MHREMPADRKANDVNPARREIFGGAQLQKNLRRVGAHARQLWLAI